MKESAAAQVMENHSVAALFLLFPCEMSQKAEEIPERETFLFLEKGCGVEYGSCCSQPVILCTA